jgi:hypothetical protein
MTTVNHEGAFESTLVVRLEGLTLRVADVARSIGFYGNKLGFAVEINKAPQIHDSAVPPAPSIATAY